MVYRRSSEIDFRPEDLERLPQPRRVLFTRPDYFAVEYAINPHMSGNVGTVDTDKAKAEWESIVRLYESLGLKVDVIPGIENLPDMVFCANQTLPYHTATDDKGVVLSHMHAPQRVPEVTHYASFFGRVGYTVSSLPESVTDFEGMGDAIWHPGRRLLWGGYGFRSSLSAYEFISDHLDVPVVAIRLADPDFYHLDTCFSVLDETTTLIFRGAFDDAGLELVQALFKRVLFAPEQEARRLFACNAHCVDGRHVIIQAGCDRTAAMLRDEGYEVIEVRTEEFLKAGGSVFCMKQMFW